jgi:hypothetical protein
MAGLRLRCGTALWPPQTGQPLPDWLARRPGPPILHDEPVSLRRQQRLAWRLYGQMAPERLRTLLDTRLHELPRMEDPGHSSGFN